MDTGFILEKPQDIEFYNIPGALAPEVGQGAHGMSPGLRVDISPSFQLVTYSPTNI